MRLSPYILRRLSLTFGLALAASLVVSCTDEASLGSGSGYFDISGSPSGTLDGGSTNPDRPGETYNDLVENPFVEVRETPVSTFSIDADGASYANCRRYLEQDRQLPPANAIRTEEFLNYFNLDYPFVDQGGHPLSINGEVAAAPWSTDTRLIRIGLKGKPLADVASRANNLVFLIDVSGSMQGADRLDLIKEGLRRYVATLTAADHISLVTYAGQASVLLAPTRGDERGSILAAINALGAGGSTAGADGINTAYAFAAEHFLPEGNNRVVLATDGDFNVGTNSQEELVTLIENRRASGIYLTVLGVGRGNYQEGALEQIANHGNGTFEYLDKPAQLEKVFVDERERFFSVATDVKIQVAFDPKVVSAYRLIGYENRLLREEDFTDDTKDAGELGANQSVTALYEIKLAAGVSPQSLKQSASRAFTIDLRYKRQADSASEQFSIEIEDAGSSFAEASPNFRFVAGVAGFAMVLRKSPYKGTTSYASVSEWLGNVSLPDPKGYIAELRQLVQTAARL